MLPSFQASMFRLGHGSRGSGHRNQLTVKAWEKTVQEVDKEERRLNSERGRNRTYLIFRIVISFNFTYLSIAFADSMPNAVWLWEVSKLCLSAMLLQSSPVRGLCWLFLMCQAYRTKLFHAKRLQNTCSFAAALKALVLDDFSLTCFVSLFENLP